MQPTRQEVDQLKQRIEELEKKQEKDEEEFGKLSDLAKYVSIGGVLSGAYQYEWVNGPSDPDDKGRGAVAFQPEVSITPTENDEIFFLFGFAAGNGLPGVTPFILAPWAAGLEDDVKDINGRNRDYLLQAWYKHTFAFSEDHSLGLTGGIIDSTNYLDDNAYANDEYTQFMNEALVNASNGILPSWDIGGALEWDYGRLGVRGVYMNVGENDDGNNFNFYGAEVMVTLETSLGEGHYRVNYNFTSKAFLDPDGTSKEQRDVLIFSFDQELGRHLRCLDPFCLRLRQSAGRLQELYTRAASTSAAGGGAANRTPSVSAYGYLDGSEQTEESLKYTHVAEGYVRFGLNDFLSLTFDLQYMKDKYVDTASDNDVDGWIAGCG